MNKRNTRDLGMGGGKGDADRTSNRAAYVANLEHVAWPRSQEGFKRVGRKQVKRYANSL